ncbi:MAG: MmcQ/YjbR family DNA-binding protein [Armatimonadetes bacterium]|nr:MmcQ/YjbR family DNA-binding protein [Armatimonadota bacterium]
MSYDDLVALAKELPDVVEGMSYGTPAIKRGKRFMLRLKEDGESVAVKVDCETKERLMSAQPDVYFQTPHYDGYPALLARLPLLSQEEARSLLLASWEDAPFPARPR